MRQESSRGRQVLSGVVALLALSVPAFGQSQAGQAAPAGQPAQGPVRTLSVDEAVRIALEQNLGVQIERVNPRLQDLAIAQARASWLPTFGSSLSTGSTNSPVSNIFAGAATKLTTDRFSAALGVDQLLPWGGGTYSASWDTSRQESNNIFATRNPTLGAGLDLSFTQPLLRNFRIDGARQQFQISQKNKEISDLQLQQAVVSVERNVKNAYWELAYQVASLGVARQSLELAQESLKNNRSRVEIGTMAPIDIIEAQAEVARREEAVILAEAAVERSEDRLRVLVFDPKMPDFWAFRIQLTDEPTFEARAIDVEAAARSAVANRTDIRQARKNLEANDINIKYFRNQTRPNLDLQVRYGVSAQGGTERELEGFPVPVEVGRTERGYGDVMRSLFAQDFPTWSIGVQVGYPIGRSSAEAALARATLQQNQGETEIRNLEMQIAAQVRDLGRQVNANQKRVDSTRASRELAERRLEAEQKKFAAGMSTSFFVFQAQRDLAEARNALLRAVLDYIRSLVDFETGQRAPVGGTM